MTIDHIHDEQNIYISNRNYNNDKIIQNNKNINSYENFQILLKELDNQSDMMNIFEKFQIVSLLKENYLYFYNNLSDIAKLFTNLSIIEYSFCGLNCTNLLMRKSHENQNGDVSRFINDRSVIFFSLNFFRIRQHSIGVYSRFPIVGTHDSNKYTFFFFFLSICLNLSE